jgi:hypothetical protein
MDQSLDLSLYHSMFLPAPCHATEKFLKKLRGNDIAICHVWSLFAIDSASQLAEACAASEFIQVVRSFNVIQQHVHMFDEELYRFNLALCRSIGGDMGNLLYGFGLSG